jgi:hypothetical protein
MHASDDVIGSTYRFTSNQNNYIEILSRQCARVGSFIYEQLQQLDRRDEDHNDKIVERISSVIELIGEPAFMTAYLESRTLIHDRFLFSKLLLAIAQSRDSFTENDRVEILRKYLSSADYRIRNIAVRALGEMNTDKSKEVLRAVSEGDRGELGHVATGLLR